MAVSIKLKSPRYPVIGLGEAIARVRKVYECDHLNMIPKAVVAEHMGYTSLNGASLGIISAVSKYGLLEGGVEGMRVSDRALAILVHEAGEEVRVEAVEAAAKAPTLFEELFAEFPSGASDNAVKSFLLGRKKFLPSAVAVAIRAFKDTLALVHQERAAYHSGTEDSEEYEEPVVEQEQSRVRAGSPPSPVMPSNGFEIGFTGTAIRLIGNIGSQTEADKVLKAIEALKLMLPPNDDHSKIN